MITENDNIIIDFIQVNEEAVTIQEEQIRKVKEEESFLAEILPADEGSYTLYIVLGICAFVFLSLVIAGCIFYNSRERKKVEEET